MSKRRATIVGSGRATRTSVPFGVAARDCRNECRHFDPIREAPLYVLHRAAGPLEDRNVTAFNLIQAGLRHHVTFYLAPREYEDARRLLASVIEVVVGDLPQDVVQAFRRACPKVFAARPPRPNACPIVTPRTRDIGLNADSRNHA